MDGIGRVFEDGSGHLETQLVEGVFGIDFQNGDQFRMKRADDVERVVVPFQAAGLTVPVGAYRFDTTTMSYTAGAQHRLAGTITLDHGGYYGGGRTALGVTSGHVSVGAHLSLEPTMSLNWLDLPDASSTARLVGTRVTYALTPRMFTSAFIQYNSTLRTAASNVRLRWEYRPGSELFVVYNDERDALTGARPRMAARTLSRQRNHGIGASAREIAPPRGRNYSRNLRLCA